MLFAVEDKAVFGINLKGAAAETAAHIVQHFAVLHDLHFAAVEIGILAAVPQMYVGNSEDYLAVGGFNFLQLVGFLVVDGIDQSLSCFQVLQWHQQEFQIPLEELTRLAMGMFSSPLLNV